MTARGGDPHPKHKEHIVPEETTPPEGNSVTTPAAPDWDSPDNPYLKRYTDTQSAYTQNQQRLRELEQYESDRDAYIRLGEKHGVQFEIEEEQQQPGIDPELAALRQQVQAQEQWRTEVEQERQERAYAEGEKAVRGQHDEWAKEAGLKLSDFDHDAIIKRALDSGANDIDDVKRVFDEYAAHKTAEREAILAEAAEARRRPRAPHVPGGGGADTGTPDFSQMTEAQALAWQVERARGLTQ
jgi:hypothetical protein